MTIQDSSIRGVGTGSSRYRRGWALVLVVALAVRIVTVVITRDLPLRDDSFDYLRLAKLIAGGHGFGGTVLAAGGGPTAFRAPAYPMFLAGIFRITNDSAIAARVVQAGIGVITVALIGAVAREVLDERHALLAASLAALYPPLVLVGNGLLTESISIPLELGVLVVALYGRRAERRSSTPRAVAMRWPALCGLLTGVGILVRPVTGVIVVPVLVLLLRRRGVGRNIVTGFVTILVLLVVLLPWELRDFRAFNRFVPVTTQDGYVLAGEYNDQAARDPHHRGVWRPPTFVPGDAELFRDSHLGEAALGDELRKRATTYARAHPRYIASAVWSNARHLFDLAGRSDAETAARSLGYGKRAAALWLYSYLMMALVAIGGALTRTARCISPAVWLAPMLFAIATVPTLGTPRYRAPIEPFVIIFAAVGLLRASERIAAGGHFG